MFRDKLLASVCKQVVARLSDCETTDMAYFSDTDNRLFVCENGLLSKSSYSIVAHHQSSFGCLFQFLNGCLAQPVSSENQQNHIFKIPLGQPFGFAFQKLRFAFSNLLKFQSFFS